MADFFRQNAAAIIALAGVTIGSVLTGAFALWNSWVLRNRDLNLKLWERFLDRRIVAHEAVVELAVKMRVVVSLGWVDPSGEIARAPQMMMSKEAFDSWIIEFTQKSAPPTTWVSTPVKRELNFVQDYFVTLNTKLSGALSKRFLVEERRKLVDERIRFTQRLCAHLTGAMVEQSWVRRASRASF